MIVRDYWRLSHVDAPPMAASYGPRARCEEWRDRDTFRNRHGYVLEAVPACSCCGEIMEGRGGNARSMTTWGGAVTRCGKHYGRNPCAIEGCRRTTAAPLATAGDHIGAPLHGDDQWLCSEHWRRHVPPRSARRRAYLAFFRQAKKRGWDDALRMRFWRFWDRLVVQARRQAVNGHLDEAAIAAMFGWSDPS